jgi:proteasome lid subunit RPN8/RPN11
MKEFTLPPRSFNVNRQLFPQIEKHALSTPDREVCGFVYADHYEPLRNLSANPNRFQADPAQVASFLATYGEPQFIFHTHPNGASKPSDQDHAEFYYPNSTMLVGIVLNGKLKLG